MSFAGFYGGRRVLVTGHTGFKGSWLAMWLHELGAEVHGLALDPPTTPNLHEVLGATSLESDARVDVRDGDAVAGAVAAARPEVVFHLAAQPIVRRSYADPVATLETNVMGTAHVLEAVRSTHCPAATVVVTSDKCYENREWDHAYREDDPLGGHDVYSMSKAAAELVVDAWRRSFFSVEDGRGPVATARAGNVIGGGDYAADRIVPDAIRALTEGEPIAVRNPSAVRPWQHVLECLAGYLWMAARLGTDGAGSPAEGAFNFGPLATDRRPVRELVDAVLAHWPGSWVDGSEPGAPHEAGRLTLATEKAEARLGWRPVWTFDEAVAATVGWYRARHGGGSADVVALTRGQIDDYTDAARTAGVAWSTS